MAQTIEEQLVSNEEAQATSRLSLIDDYYNDGCEHMVCRFDWLPALNGSRTLFAQFDFNHPQGQNAYKDMMECIKYTFTTLASNSNRGFFWFDERL